VLSVVDIGAFTSRGGMFNSKLIEIARNLIRSECNRRRSTLDADVKKIKSLMPPGHLAFQVKRKIAERYAQEVEAWGDIVWRSFI
jgi:hypothetical protein